MATRLLLSFILLAASVFAADTKGVCPPPPPKPNLPDVSKADPKPPAPGMKYAGTVILMIVLSDTGFVCDAEILRGLNKEADEQAIAAVRQQSFQPAKKAGKPVPVVLTIDVPYWWKDGQLVRSPRTQDSGQTNSPK